MEFHGAFTERIDELVDQRVCGMTYFIRCALGCNTAIGLDDDLVRNSKGVLKVVRHHNAGDAYRVIELAYQPGRRTKRDRIETGKGFVIHDEFGVQYHGPGQRDAPGHTARNFAGHEVTRTAQADSIEFHQHDIANQRFIESRVLPERESDVVENAQISEQRAELEQHSHATARGVEIRLHHLGDVFAVKQHLAAIGLLLAAYQAQHGGLSAAGSAHECRDLAARDGKIEFAEDDAVTRRRGVGKRHIPEFNQ